MGFRWANNARFYSRLHLFASIPVSIEDQFGCQTSACHLGVFTGARIIHRNPFRNAYKSRDSVATEGKERGGGRPEKVSQEGGTERGREMKGLSCRATKDAATCKRCTRAPLLEKDYSSLFKRCPGFFEPWKSAGMIRVNRPVFSLDDQEIVWRFAAETIPLSFHPTWDNEIRRFPVVNWSLLFERKKS